MIGAGIAIGTGDVTVARPGFRGDLASSHRGALRKRRPVSEGAIKLPYCTRTLPHRVCAADGMAFCLALTTVELASGVRHLCGQRDGFMLADVHHPLRDGASKEAISSLRTTLGARAGGCSFARGGAGQEEWSEGHKKSEMKKKKKKTKLLFRHVSFMCLFSLWFYADFLLSRPAYSYR